MTPARRSAPPSTVGTAIRKLPPVRLLVPVVAVVAYALTALALVVWPPVVAIVLAVTWPFDRDRLVAGRLLRLCGAFVSRSFPFWRIRIEGRWPPGRGAYVVAANHQSFLDIFLISNIPHEMKWVAKRSLFKIPWVGWAFYLSGDIPVDRGDVASAASVLARARRYLERGVSVMMFPEGTRSRDGKLLPFKSGAFKLAIDAGVPVLPIAVSGTAQGMPKGSPWVRPSRLRVQVLEPVPSAGMTEGDVSRLRDEVRARIARALDLDPGPPRGGPRARD
jgi:1-acyl-sn-glycerol-3-phosphate acyltransferase